MTGLPGLRRQPLMKTISRVISATHRGRVEEADVVQPEDELHRARPAVHVRVGDARVEYPAAVRDEEQREGGQRGTGDPAAPVALVSAGRGRILARGKRCRLIRDSFLPHPSSPKRSTRCELTPSASRVRATR